MGGHVDGILAAEGGHTRPHYINSLLVIYYAVCILFVKFYRQDQ